MTLLEDSSIDQFIVPPEWDSLRIDKVLALKYQELHSRTYFQKLLEQGAVLLNNIPVEKKRIPVREGMEVEVRFENLTPPEAIPENIPLDILYEDNDLLVIHKPAGMVVHPAPGNWTGTVANALLYYCGETLKGSDTLRPGIIHRLDKDTSGLLVAAKNPQSLRKMADLFASREVYKEYLAVCIGHPGSKVVELPIGRHRRERQKMAVREDGKEAKTEFKTLYSGEGLSLVSALLHTGRTHQIRVHLQALGCPVLGDAVYGSVAVNRRMGAKRQLLHAWKLRFVHPMTGKTLAFCAPIPDDLQQFIPKEEIKHLAAGSTKSELG